MAKPKTSSQIEYQIQVALAQYLQYQWPDVQFRSDLGGIRLTIGQAVKANKTQKGKAWPDMFISESCGGWHGLYLEIKKDRDEIYLKSGELSKGKHVQEQKEMLDILCEKGYLAMFACGIDEARLITDSYLAGELNIKMSPEAMKELAELIRRS